MTLVDTSVWIDHFRGLKSAARLHGLLEIDEVLLHPFVSGELALGTLGARTKAVLADLRYLPSAPLVAHDEVVGMVEKQRLGGSGIGWVDAHLLGSAAVTRARLWTHDRRLAAVATRLGLA